VEFRDVRNRGVRDGRGFLEITPMRSNGSAE
jgi:hypothetical protein